MKHCWAIQLPFSTMLLLMTFLTVPLAVSSSPQRTHPGFYKCHNKNPCTGEIGRNLGLLPYEGDVSKYVECSGLRCFERSCSLGTVFNWIEQTCGYESGPSQNQPESAVDPIQPLSQEPQYREELVCEEYEMDLSCPEGKVIKIIFAMYGRLNYTGCQHPTINKTVIYGCSANVFTGVSGRCNYYQQCKIPVKNNLVVDDPCPGTYKYLQVFYECTDPCADLDIREQHFLNCQEERLPFPPTSRNPNLCPSTNEWVLCSLNWIGSCPEMRYLFDWVVRPLLGSIVPICGDKLQIPPELMNITDILVQDGVCAYEQVCLLMFHIDLKRMGLEGLLSLELFKQSGMICRYRSRYRIDFGVWFECAAKASFKCGRPDFVAGILRFVMDMSITDSIMLISSIAEYILKTIGAWNDYWINSAAWNAFIEHLCDPACPGVIPTVMSNFPKCFSPTLAGCSDLEAATNCTMEYLPSCELVRPLVHFISQYVLGYPSCV